MACYKERASSRSILTGGENRLLLNVRFSKNIAAAGFPELWKLAT